MSLERFLREHGAAMRAGDESDHQERVREAYHEVRDRWLRNREYEALVKGILGNWTSGNCVDFMLPVTRQLLTEHLFDLHRHLWTRTIKRQVQDFFREYSHIRSHKLGFEGILAIDSEGFNEFDWGSYVDHGVAASFLLRRLIADLSTWRSELSDATLSTVDPDSIAQSLRGLRSPRIEVNRLPRRNKSPARATAP